MNISKILDTNLIIKLKHNNKTNILEQLIQVITDKNTCIDKTNLTKKIFDREELMSTGIGMSLAVPHARLKCVTNPIIAIGISKTPIADYESIDDQPIKVVMMILCGENEQQTYIKILSQMVKVFKKENIIEKILNDNNSQEIFQFLIEG